MKIYLFGSTNRCTKLYSVYTCNPLPDDKILAIFKLKAFADDNFILVQMLQFFLVKLEYVVDNGRKCWLPAFSPVPVMYSKGFLWWGGGR